MSPTASPRRLLVATRNNGKLVELRALFAELGVELVDLSAAGIAETDAEEGLEIHPTFEANALAKALYFHDLSGLPTIADDSGLSVEALGGAPGVRSKRYAQDAGAPREVESANNAKLMRALAARPDRRARFVCAAAYVDWAIQIVRRGEVEGDILDGPRGSQGFGYDPYFFSPEIGMTFGEAEVAAKQRVSHRARAFRALVDHLAADRAGQSVG